MIARSPARAGGEDWRELARWLAAAGVVLFAHAALVGLYLAWHGPVETVGDDTPTIAIDLIAPDIDQLEQQAIEKPVPPRETATQPVAPKDETPPPPQETLTDAIAPTDEKPVPPQETATETIAQKEEKPTPPQEPTTDAIAPKEKLPEKVEASAPAQRTTVQSVASAPHIDPSWQSLLIKHIQHFKRYPQTARDRNEQGVVVLAVSLDRDGHLLSRRIVSGSGFADLDAEVLALVERAQPMPAFPPSMRESQLDLTMPIRFSLR
jgi:periplasmic protein TonB